MGLFEFFRKNQPPAEQPNTVIDVPAEKPVTPDIPRELFIEDKEPNDMQAIPSLNGQQVYSIDTIYSFLQGDYETRGYGDALTNPDESNKLDGLKLIKLDLQILIERVNNYYDKKINDFDFHISSRSRAGLVDLVEELKAEKDKVLNDIEKVKEIESDVEPGSGMVERIILSYQKGFLRGMSAITQAKILK